MQNVWLLKNSSKVKLAGVLVAGMALQSWLWIYGHKRGFRLFKPD